MLQATVSSANERSHSTRYVILNSSNAKIHFFTKKSYEEAEAYYLNYCKANRLDSSKHILASVGA